MLFNYEALTPEGEKKSGSIEASNSDLAVDALQKRNLIIVSIRSAVGGGFFLQRRIKFFERIKTRDVVILSRQMSTLFEAKVPILDSLKILIGETGNQALRDVLTKIVDDIQSGIPLSAAMNNHPAVFSDFYVGMIRAGEESGKLNDIFSYLADYLEHSYDLNSKAKNAMIYPAFVITAFIAVITLMMVFIIPKLGEIVKDTGQELPFSTKIILGMSDFIKDFGVLLLVAFSGGVVFLWQYAKTSIGKKTLARLILSIPVVGGIFQKIYLSRLSASLETLLASGIPVIRSLEISADVVSNEVYKEILLESVENVKSGNPISEVISKYKEIPPLFSQMLRIGEETGKLNFILKTLSSFYKREVNNALEGLVSLIEPILIAVLGLGVGFLLLSVLGPIYNISTGF